MAKTKNFRSDSKNLYLEKFAIIQQKEKKKRPDGLIKWVGIQTQLIQILLQEIHVIFGVDLFLKKINNIYQFLFNTKI